MIIQTKDFKEAANQILIATEVDKNAANLEISIHDSFLYLSATNREYYVSVKFPIDTTETFRAVVDAALFLNLISGITSDTFELDFKENYLQIKSGKSKYKLPMIFEGDQLLKLPLIFISEPNVEMPISLEILDSILGVNGKEVQKAKQLQKIANINELQKLYYIDETGCFTFTVGACLNSFTLEKPIKLLLNDKIVKLFKLFNEDVNFKYGHEIMPDGSIRDKIVLSTDSIYMAALVTCDDILINKIQGPKTATQHLIQSQYSTRIVIAASALASAIARLMLFTKNSGDKPNMCRIMANIKIAGHELIITDTSGNQEVLNFDNEVYGDDYEMNLNLYDLKMILDSCKNEHVTIECGNHTSVVISRGSITNLVQEMVLSN